jgi:5-methylcytosine-specific restriction endonuclease McrA
MPRPKLNPNETAEQKRVRVLGYKRKFQEREKTDPRLRELRRLNKLRNRATKTANQKARRIANREASLAYEQKYREAHRDKLREHQRTFRARNADHVRQYRKAFRDANLEQCREWEKKWRRKNPDNIRDRVLRRRARLVNATVEDCTAKITALKRENHCHWCNRDLTPSTVTIDHVIPIARGGKHCGDNLVAACGSCNYSRGDKLVEEWKREAA